MNSDALEMSDERLQQLRDEANNFKGTRRLCGELLEAVNEIARMREGGRPHQANPGVTDTLYGWTKQIMHLDLIGDWNRVTQDEGCFRFTGFDAVMEILPTGTLSPSGMSLSQLREAIQSGRLLPNTWPLPAGVPPEPKPPAGITRLRRE